MEGITETNWTRWNRVVYHPKFYQFPFENVDIDFWYSFGDKYIVSLTSFCVTLYLGFVLWLKYHMKDKEPFRLRLPLFVWNMVVGTFSIVACCRICSELLPMLNTPDGFYRSACLREGLHMSTAYYAVLIAFSKFFFAVDTVFLVLRKKPIDAVHVVHHLIAMLFGPALIKLAEPFVRWVGVANLLVHAIDYPILALRSVKIMVPKSRHIMVALEVAQMLFVIFISAYTLAIRASGTYCLRHPKSITITYCIYSGLLFFVIVTALSPEYWERGTKKLRKISDKED